MQYTIEYKSPLGDMLLASDGESLVGAWFVGQKYFAAGLEPNHVSATVPILDLAKRWLDLYFRGKVPDFDVPCRFSGTPFQNAVWEIVAKIPHGSTLAYGEIARMVKNGGSVVARAVGSTVGRNPISVIVPCHRVVASGGAVSGYAGGAERKAALLRLEGIEK